MIDPARERTLPRMVAAAVARYGPQTAIEDGGVRLTFEELDAAGWRAARAFLAEGIGHGDRVAIWAPNVAEWVIVGMTCWHNCFRSAESNSSLWPMSTAVVATRPKAECPAYRRLTSTAACST